MNGKTARKTRRTMNRAVEGKMREYWAALAALPLRDRAKLAWWMLNGKQELPK